MTQATKAQGKRALKRWKRAQAEMKLTPHDKFVKRPRNAFALGARIKPEVFNALNPA